MLRPCRDDMSSWDMQGTILKVNVEVWASLNVHIKCHCTDVRGASADTVKKSRCSSQLLCEFWFAQWGEGLEDVPCKDPMNSKNKERPFLCIDNTNIFLGNIYSLTSCGMRLQEYPFRKVTWLKLHVTCNLKIRYQLEFSSSNITINTVFVLY